MPLFSSLIALLIIVVFLLHRWTSPSDRKASSSSNFLLLKFSTIAWCLFSPPFLGEIGSLSSCPGLPPLSWLLLLQFPPKGILLIIHFLPYHYFPLSSCLFSCWSLLTWTTSFLFFLLLGRYSPVSWVLRLPISPIMFELTSPRYQVSPPVFFFYFNWLWPPPSPTRMDFFWNIRHSFIGFGPLSPFPPNPFFFWWGFCMLNDSLFKYVRSHCPSFYSTSP